MEKQILSYTTALIFFLIILGLIIVRIQKNDYKLSMEESLQELTAKDVYATESDFNSIVENKDFEFLLIDLRDSIQYIETHANNAINIPIKKLYAHINDWDYDDKIILYCAYETRSTLALSMLRQLGYKNTSIIAGGYASIKKNTFAVNVEKAALPFHEFIAIDSTQIETQKTSKIKVEIPEVQSIKGGC